MVSTVGTNTAAIVASGYSGTVYLTVAETWNGSAWTELQIYLQLEAQDLFRELRPL